MCASSAESWRRYDSAALRAQYSSGPAMTSRSCAALRPTTSRMRGRFSGRQSGPVRRSRIHPSARRVSSTLSPESGDPELGAPRREARVEIGPKTEHLASQAIAHLVEGDGDAALHDPHVAEQLGQEADVGEVLVGDAVEPQGEPHGRALHGLKRRGDDRDAMHSRLAVHERVVQRHRRVRDEGGHRHLGLRARDLGVRLVDLRGAPAQRLTWLARPVRPLEPRELGGNAPLARDVERPLERGARAGHHAARSLEQPPRRDALSPRVRLRAGDGQGVVVGALLRERLSKARLAVQVGQLADPEIAVSALPEPGRRVERLVQLTPRLDDPRLHALAERRELGRPVGQSGDRAQTCERQLADRAERREVAVHGGHALDAEERGLTEIVADVQPDGGRAEVHDTPLLVDERVIHRGAVPPAKAARKTSISVRSAMSRRRVAGHASTAEPGWSAVAKGYSTTRRAPGSAGRGGGRSASVM